MRIAVLSDLHCHPTDQSPRTSFLFSDAPARPALDHPITSLLEMIRENTLKADVVVAPGDITDKVSQHGLLSGWRYVQDVAQELGAPLCVATVGNHDVDSRNKHGSNPFDFARRASDSFPLPNRNENDHFWSKGFSYLAHSTLSLLVLNSVHGHHSVEEAERGEIDAQQVSAIRERLKSAALNDFRVAIVHHHPIQHDEIGLGAADIIVGASDLLSMLSEFQFQLIIHGHKHHPRLAYDPQRPQNGPAIFASASFSAQNSWGLQTNTRNLFHIVELQKANDDGRCLGRIQSWEFSFKRGWFPPNARSADFPEFTGFGCRTIQGLPERIQALILKAPHQHVSWDEIEDKIPETKHLIPGDFLALGEQLSALGLYLVPTPPDRPKIAGIPHRRGQQE